METFIINPLECNHAPAGVILISVLLLGNYERNVLKGLDILVWRVDGGLWFIWVVFILSLIMGLCNLVLGKVRGIKNSWYLLW